jgi:hypothetical protein
MSSKLLYLNWQIPNNHSIQSENSSSSNIELLLSSDEKKQETLPDKNFQKEESPTTKIIPLTRQSKKRIKHIITEEE